MEGLNEHGYCGLDNMTKVTRPLNRIKIDSIDAMKSNIMQDRKLCRYCEGCVTFYTEFIKKSIADQSNEARRVAEVGSHKKSDNDVKS